MRFLFLAVLCALLVACELDENIVINRDGSGTYTARISVEKQFAGALTEIKSKAAEGHYTVVEESDTADRHVLVIRREFHDIAELNDRTDHYALRVDRASRFKTSYFLQMKSGGGGAFNGFQKRAVHITMPVGVTSATGATISGNRVEWDATNGGTLEVEASGVAMPFGLSPLIAVIVLALLAVAFIVLRRRRVVVRTCSACQTPAVPGARFCAKCGSAISASTA
jgi:hypothetical protein